MAQHDMYERELLSALKKIANNTGRIAKELERIGQLHDEQTETSTETYESEEA